VAPISGRTKQFFWDETEVTDRLNRMLERSFAQVMRRAGRDGVAHRTAAMAIGVERGTGGENDPGTVSVTGLISCGPTSQGLRWHDMPCTPDAGE
jgi:hypothetical protein